MPNSFGQVELST